MHPDGDEILYVISGKIRITCDSGVHPLELEAGQAGVVRKGERRKVDCIEESQFVHITPGPNGDTRF